MMLTSPDIPRVVLGLPTSCSPWKGDIKFLLHQGEEFLLAVGWPAQRAEPFWGDQGLFLWWQCFSQVFYCLQAPLLFRMPFYGAPS